MTNFDKIYCNMEPQILKALKLKFFDSISGESIARALHVLTIDGQPLTVEALKGLLIDIKFSYYSVAPFSDKEIIKILSPFAAQLKRADEAVRSIALTNVLKKSFSESSRTWDAWRARAKKSLQRARVLRHPAVQRHRVQRAYRAPRRAAFVVSTASRGDAGGGSGGGGSDDGGDGPQGPADGIASHKNALAAGQGVHSSILIRAAVGRTALFVQKFFSVCFKTILLQHQVRRWAA